MFEIDQADGRPHPVKAYQSLPEGYREILQINLQKDKQAALKISIGGGIAMFILLVIGSLIVPIRELFSMGFSGNTLLKIGVLLLGYIAYIILHELTHAAVMKAVGGGKVVFGFTGLYAFAGSKEDFFDKAAYRYIALAPLVLWGIIFAVMSAAVPHGWFWVIWFLQAGNIGGAAGDVFVTVKLWKKPASILVMDTGVDMTVFDR